MVPFKRTLTYHITDPMVKFMLENNCEVVSFDLQNELFTFVYELKDEYAEGIPEVVDG